MEASDEASSNVSVMSQKASQRSRRGAFDITRGDGSRWALGGGMCGATVQEHDTIQRVGRSSMKVTWELI